MLAIFNYFFKPKIDPTDESDERKDEKAKVESDRKKSRSSTDDSTGISTGIELHKNGSQKRMKKKDGKTTKLQNHEISPVESDENRNDLTETWTENQIHQSAAIENKNKSLTSTAQVIYYNKLNQHNNQPRSSYLDSEGSKQWKSQIVNNVIEVNNLQESFLQSAQEKSKGELTHNSFGSSEISQKWEEYYSKMNNKTNQSATSSSEITSSVALKNESLDTSDASDGSISIVIKLSNIPPNWKPKINVEILKPDQTEQLIPISNQTNQANLPIHSNSDQSETSKNNYQNAQNACLPKSELIDLGDEFNNKSNVENTQEYVFEAVTLNAKTDTIDVNTSNSKLPEYNILLLGETGAGKSTTINAFANYMKYSSFEEAKSHDLIQLIPSKFTLPDVKTGKPFVVQSGGSDANENLQEDGSSNTQGPVGYVFRDRDRIIRIIDTPGMGDTRGAEVDRQNFELILGYLNYLKQLHGICILIKSNETRKTASFRYCITELMSHLHKSACRNITFCFTFGRNSFYGPGEGYSILRSFLQDELKETNLQAQNKVNCFFIDNEGYRFLVAKKQGYAFSEGMEKMYEESWNKSATATQLMVNGVVKLEAHNLEQTLNLNYARKLMMELAEPMVRLQKCVRNNIQQITLQNARLENSRQTRNLMNVNLQFQVEDLEMRMLPCPKTVCTETKCVEVIYFQGKQKINYKSNCHVGCILRIGQHNTPGQNQLKNCKAMGKGKCVKCGCHWSKHMHVISEYVNVKRDLIDQNTLKGINSISDSIGKITILLEKSKLIQREYEEELKIIKQVAARFGYLLQVHSNTSNNKFLEPYLDKLIEEENKLSHFTRNHSPNDKIMFEDIKADHLRLVEKLSTLIANERTKDVFLSEIPNFRDRLFALRITGPQFQQMMLNSKAGKQQEFKHFDKLALDLSQ